MAVKSLPHWPLVLHRVEMMLLLSTNEREYEKSSIEMMLFT